MNNLEFAGDRCKACVGDRADRCQELRRSIGAHYLDSTHMPTIKFIIEAPDDVIEDKNRLKKELIQMKLSIFQPAVDGGLGDLFFDIGCELDPEDIVNNFISMVTYHTESANE